MTHMHKRLDAERQADLARDAAEHPGKAALADYIITRCLGCTHPSICDSHGCGNDQAKPTSAAQALAQLRTAAQRALAAWDSTVLPVVNDGRMQETMEALRAEVNP